VGNALTGLLALKFCLQMKRKNADRAIDKTDFVDLKSEF